MSRCWPLLVLHLWAVNASGAETLAHGRFADVHVYAPRGPVQQVVLLLSDAAGWTQAMARIARRLEHEETLVIGIDSAALLTTLDDGGSCASAVGDFENLSHFVQGYRHVPGYFPPLLAGVGRGAALAYATLAQASDGIFAGLLTVDFCPTLALPEPLCAGDGQHQPSTADGDGQALLPAALPAPWFAFTHRAARCAGTADTRTFIARAHATERRLGHRDLRAADWRTALRTLAPVRPRQATAGGDDLGGLPVVEVPTAQAGTRFAILLSGDGGWAGLDKRVAEALAAQGLPVVGFDSLRYFWSPRTPQALATDLARLVRHYAARWHRPEVVLIGYSQGADVLPFAVNRLPRAARLAVSHVVLVAPGARASFEFHLDNWLRRDDDGPPTAPEVGRLAGDEVLCVSGRDDTDALCPSLPPGTATVDILPGDHHFDGDYAGLAAQILAHVALPLPPHLPGRPSLPR